MRVIRTEMYFSSSDLTWNTNNILQNPGVAVAFFRVENNHGLLIKSIVTDPISLSQGLEAPAWPGNAPTVIHLFLSSVLEGSDDFFQMPTEPLRRVNNEHVVNFILEQPIVIEQSPPSAELLKGLFAKSASIVIGTFIGTTVAGENPLLMFLSIPAGIIVVGSAIGLSKGLESGLNKAIEKLIKERWT